MKNKIRISASFLLAIMLPFFVSAQWDDCSKGEENCEFPGECGSYVDTNRDQICDHSQPEPVAAPTATKKTKEVTAVTEEVVESDDHDVVTGQEVKTMTVGEVAEAYGIDADEYAAALSQQYGVKIVPADEFQTLHDSAGIRPSDAKTLAEGLVAGVAVEKKESTTSEKKTAEVQKKNKRAYHLLSITLVLLALYFFTWLLVKKEKDPSKNLECSSDGHVFAQRHLRNSFGDSHQLWFANDLSVQFAQDSCGNGHCHGHHHHFSHCLALEVLQGDVQEKQVNGNQ